MPMPHADAKHTPMTRWLLTVLVALAVLAHGGTESFASPAAVSLQMETGPGTASEGTFGTNPSAPSSLVSSSEPVRATVRSRDHCAQGAAGSSCSLDHGAKVEAAVDAIRPVREPFFPFAFIIPSGTAPLGALDPPRSR